MKFQSDIPSIKSYARTLMSLALLFSDLAAIFLAGTLAVAARLFLEQGWQPSLYVQILPVAVALLIFYTLRELYPAIGMSVVEELRRLTLTTSVVVLSLAGLTFFARNPENYSRLTLGLTWVFSLASVPLGRAITRSVATRLRIWGEPVVVIGNGKRGRKLVESLLENRQLGFYPVAILDCFKDANGNLGTIPVLSAKEALVTHNLPGLKSVKTAILVISEVSKTFAEGIINDQYGGFRRLILVPEQEGINSMGVTPLALNGILGLQVHHNLMSTLAQIQKRVMDIFGAIFGLILLSPFFALLAILIKRDSPGRVFYRQTRIGKDGKSFGMVKFRSMLQNADEVLEDHLRYDPELRREWDRFQKLKEDPRVTPLGAFIRKYSIDEFPQLWNVLAGEMSLVGPRPFLPEQRDLYGEGFTHYIRVCPGMTGMWQISGRNVSEFGDRPYWDEYYVRNWSIWLDLYILARTVWVVLRREGAY